MAGPPKMGERERTLARLSASAFVEMRKRGEVTCEEYAEVLVKRAKHYKYMGQFMYFDILPNQMDQYGGLGGLESWTKRLKRREWTH
eukprot:1130805-Amorphochlora_amoeboformis.AAC.1